MIIVNTKRNRNKDEKPDLHVGVDMHSEFWWRTIFKDETTILILSPHSAAHIQSILNSMLAWTRHPLYKWGQKKIGRKA